MPPRPQQRLVSGAMSERAFQDEVWRLAAMHGWRLWHFNDSRRQVGGRLVGDEDAAGFPDLVMVHPRWGIVFAELKSDKGRLTPTQKASLAALAGGVAAVLMGGLADKSSGARIYVHVWRPADLVTVILPVIQGRGANVPTTHGVTVA